MRTSIKYHDGLSMSLLTECFVGQDIVQKSAPRGWYVFDNDGMTGGMRWTGPYADKYDIPAHYHPMFHPK